MIRSVRGWGTIAYILFAGHFAVPFLLLLWPQVQRSRRALLAISGLLVAVQIPRAWWLVIPAAGRSLSWVDGFAMLALGGLSVGLGLRAMRVPTLPRTVRQHV